MAKGLLKSGAKPARGGAREGAGRKPDWLKQKCAGLVDRKKLLEYVANVANGDEVERYFDKVLGRTIEIPCSTKDRLHAVELLLERGYGKPVQGVEVNGNIAQTFDVVIKVADL